MKYNNLMKKYRIFLFSFVTILFLLNFRVIKIQGNSMYPTLKNNTFAIADKYLHKLFAIQKGDILLLKIDNKEVVKKIVGFPGETIIIDSNTIELSKDEIYIIGENLSESIDSREYGPVKLSNILGKVVLSF
jgi:signal peptidase I